MNNLADAQLSSFCNPEIVSLQKGVELIDPKLRQFGDLPAWLFRKCKRPCGQKGAHVLHRRREMRASLCIAEGNGGCFQDVFQLQGKLQTNLLFLDLPHKARLLLRCCFI